VICSLGGYSAKWPRPSVPKINLHSAVELGWEMMEEGRKTIHYSFSIIDHSQ